MALTYSQLDALTTTDAFLARVRTAISHYAIYLRDSQSPTAAQSNWVQLVFQQKKCSQIATDMARELVQDSKFTSAANADASDVTDADLQTAVEAICLKYTGV